MAYPLISDAHPRLKAIAKNAAIQSAIYSHASSCGCGCHSSAAKMVEAAAPLANNRKLGDSLQPRGFQDSLKTDVATHQDKYHTNFDSLAYAGSKTQSVVMESYILSNIIAKMEANTDFFPKGTDKTVAGNCGKRVMSPKLRKKIFGLDFSGGEYDYSKSSVDIIDYRGTLGYTGNMCCHNPWGCPICARKVSEKRKKGLSKLINAHFDMFEPDSISASLFTIPHGLGDDLKDISDRLLKCYSDMTHSRGYKTLMKTLYGCGSSRANEVTWAIVNGFHPHLHVLNFFEKCLILDVNFLADTLFSLWCKALQKNGFSLPSRKAFGCKIIPSSKVGIDAVASYFAKPEADVNDADVQGYLKKHKNVRGVKGRDVSGWTTEHEMTKWHLKQAQQDGENFRYSMFDFPRGYAIATANGDEETRKKFRALWLNYRTAFKRKSQLYTRHKYLKIAELELSDEELGAEAPEEKETKVVYSIPFELWLMVVYMGARGTLLEMARRSGVDGIEKALSLVREGYECLPESRQILH